jgi:branched-chain amino acid transport system permease protein
MSEVIIDCLFALSLNMLIGYSGMVSFGQSAFFAVGAYSAAVFITKLGWPMSISFSIAPFVAALWAAIIGIFCIRRTGVYFIMLTLAMAQVVYAAISQWYDFTGGDNGIIGVCPSPLIASPLRYYYFTLIVSLLAGYGIYRVLHSPFGYSLRAFRDNPRRAESIGIDVWKARFIIFILAGFFSGVSGTLYAFFNAAAFPNYAFWLKSAEPLIATILGGPFHFAGPIMGAVIMTLLRTLLTRYITYWMFTLGIIMVALILFFRRGLSSLLVPKQES